jgi:hypothetical protein
MDKVKVIFRKGTNGEVMAFFPELPACYGMITCYQHIGQHSEASVMYYWDTTKALPSEYAELYEELMEIYGDCELIVRQRLSYNDLAKAWNWKLQET